MCTREKYANCASSARFTTRIRIYGVSAKRREREKAVTWKYHWKTPVYSHVIRLSQVNLRHVTIYFCANMKHAYLLNYCVSWSSNFCTINKFIAFLHFKIFPENNLWCNSTLYKKKICCVIKAEIQNIVQFIRLSFFSLASFITKMYRCSSSPFLFWRWNFSVNNGTVSQ